MKYLAKIALVLVALLSAEITAAQTLRKFSSEPEKYYEDLYGFMTAQYEGGEALMNEFHAIWKIGDLPVNEQEKIYKTANAALRKRMKAQGDSIPFQYGANSKKLSDEQIQFIVTTSNALLKKRMKPSQFSSYLLTLIIFETAGQTTESFTGWQASLNKLIEKSRANKISSFLDFSSVLFESNVLYKSPSVTWLSSNNNYIFDFDSLPKVIFPALDLKCFSKGDSSIIYQTSGTYYPTNQIWEGKGGTVNWLRAGITENIVLATLSNYSIELKRATYSAENVTFYNKNFFDNKLTGTLTDKVKANIDVENASYPRFVSNDKRLHIDNIFDKVNYVGGFSMEGAKLIGLGSEEEDAYLIFRWDYENDTIKASIDRFLVAASKKFVIEEKRITSSKSAIKIYLDEDSIYHPQLRLRFVIKKINDKIINRELTLIREEAGLAQSPYFNSYHALEMDFEAIYWDIDDPQIKFWKLLGISKDSEASFASADYYRHTFYEQIQGRDQYNPLVKLKQFSKENADTREFYVNEFSAFLRLPIVDVRQQIMNLTNMGFLDFDFAEDRVFIKEKVFDYLAANAGKQDYDVIKFRSNTKNNKNASLNLLNNDLNINGVRSIFLSDSQNVYIYPTNQKITVKKNRDFTFAGQVHAGLFDFFGREFAFEYDNFKINLKNVDSLRLSVYGEENKEGSRDIIPIKTVIEHINGELLVDKPFNKSGYKPSPTYPIFHSLKDSYTFYQRLSIQRGVYKKKDFYFHLEPFTIDSLDNFDPASIALKGTFVSGGIFPDFDEYLGVMPDYSLGFTRPTPEAGFEVYGGKGKYTSAISLSHEGLQGSGTLEYLRSTAEADNITFFPDSLNAHAQSYVNKEAKEPTEFPQVIAKSVFVHWDPPNDVMYVYNKKAPMDLFNGEATIHGRIALKPDGVEGAGLVSFSKARLTSRLIKFNNMSFDADTAGFKLATDVESEFAFSTDNVKAHVDFVERNGIFRSNIGGSLVVFAPNQYICYVSEFTWDMDRGDIALSTTSSSTIVEGGEEVVLKGSKFTSIHPKQDSLYFFAEKANYDVKSKVITAEQVDFIHVADARIYPDSGIVVVRKKAKMDSLKNAKIMANIVTKYHNIHGADIKIFGKKSYKGVGMYDYIDNMNRKQTIYFGDIGVDSTIRTYAVGEISDTAHFALSAKFAFSGKTSLTATQKYLNFEGFCKISHNCDKIISHWFQINTEINPEEIYIPITDSSLNLTDDILSYGLILNQDSFNIYSTFLSPLSGRRDLEMITTNGFLYYDKTSNEYQISNKDKLIEIRQPGNYISLKTNDCIVYGEGRIGFGESIGQVKLSTTGIGQHYLDKDSLELDLLMAVDFFIADQSMKAMAVGLQEDIDLTPLDFDRPVYERGLMEMVGKNVADKLVSEVTLLGSFKKFPDELEKSIVFTDLKMYWNKELKSYISSGPIGIGNIGKRQVNKNVEGIVEIRKRRGGDVLNIYLKQNEDSWYFFTYSRGLMQAVSTNEDFNNPIREEKPAKRKLKVEEKGGMPYQYIISSERKKKVFLSRVQPIE